MVTPEKESDLSSEHPLLLQGIGIRRAGRMGKFQSEGFMLIRVSALRAPTRAHSEASTHSALGEKYSVIPEAKTDLFSTKLLGPLRGARRTQRHVDSLGALLRPLC